MIVFGLLSSAVDLLTFAILRLVFDASAELFRSDWFVESVITELTVLLVLRTQRPFYRSRPGRALVLSSIVVAALTPLLSTAAHSPACSASPRSLPRCCSRWPR